MKKKRFLYLALRPLFWLTFALVWLAAKLFAKLLVFRRYEVGMINLSLAFPNKTLKEKKVILKGVEKYLTSVMTEAFKYLIEFKFNHKAQEMLKPATVDIDKRADEIIKKDSSIVLITAHQHFWFLTVALKFLNPKDIAGTYMTQARSFRSKIYKTLLGKELKVFEAGPTAGIQMVNFLKKGGTLNITNDLGVVKGGEFFNFFGRPCVFGMSPMKVAAMAKTPILFAIFKKTSSKKYHAQISTLFDGKWPESDDKKQKKAVMTKVGQKFVNKLEESLIKAPDKTYIWLNRRWKKIPPNSDLPNLYQQNY